MKRRGQLTIFIIVAIVVVLGLVTFYFLRDSIMNSPISGSEVVVDALVECVDYMSSSSLAFVSYQGGYNTPPERHFNFSPTFFPYYYYEGVSLVPSLSDIEFEMGNFVADNLGDCFDSLGDAGFEVSYDAPVVDVSVSEAGAEYIVDTSVTLSRDGQTMRVDMEDYPQFYETKLYYMYDAASFFVEDQVEDPEFYCISCISAMAEEHGFKFYIFPLVQNVYFVMIFEDVDDPTIFNFVAKYESQNETQG